jgi:hypothetical protein
MRLFFFVGLELWVTRVMREVDLGAKRPQNVYFVRCTKLLEHQIIGGGPLPK